MAGTDYIVVAVEEHPKTGGYHIHCYVDKGTAFIINDPRFFDFFDVHPNIKPVRKAPYKAYVYAIKDGSIIFEDGTPPEVPTHLAADDRWASILSSGTKEEFLETAEELAPRDFCLHFNSLLSCAEWKYRDNPGDYKTPEVTCYYEDYPILYEWVHRFINNPVTGRPTSLVIWGPTRIGKTLWARSLGKHAYFPGLFMLEGFNPKETQYAVFDDMLDGIKSIPNFKYWLGGQKEFVVGDKYMRKQRIEWNKPSILISNSDPRIGCCLNDVSWLEGNCIFLEITGSLIEPLN